MTFFDWAIVLFVGTFAVRGFRHGAVIGVSSLVGFLGGIWLGTQLAGKLLAEGSASPYAPLLALSAALVVGLVIGELTLAVGYRVRVRFTSHIARRIDGALGAVLLSVFALGVVWAGAAAIMQSRASGGLRDSIRHSTVIRQLNAVLPPTSGMLNALARIDPLRQVKGPSANVPAPDIRIVYDPDVRAAAASTVRVTGSACDYGVEGSGWVAGAGLVVTNAHVVAGQTDTSVQVNGSGAALPATTVWFDPRNDLALLSVQGLVAPSLRLEDSADKGLPVAIIGYPLNGPLSIVPARVGATQQSITTDIYGDGPLTRPMMSFRGEVRHGNSGGPLIDENGFVRGTVFASESGSDDSRGYGVPGDVIRGALEQVKMSVPVSTGACT